MSKYEKLKSYLPQIYEEVKEFEEIMKADGIAYDDLENNIELAENNLFLDTATNIGLIRYENIYGISAPVGATEAERRNVIKSTLRGIDKLSATSIKNISLAYKNGDVDVSFLNSSIIIKFTSVYGIPSNLEQLQNYLNLRKPAHIGIIYEFLYKTWGDVSNLTWSTIKTGTWEDLKVV